MSNRGEETRTRGSTSRPPFLHERVGQVYYAHGLFCTSYPATVISFTILIALLCCYPLLNLPLPGNLPLQVWNSQSNASNLELLSGKPPWCYVQQVLLRTAVLPWDSNLYLGDAFRAPLYEAFKLLDVVRNYQESEGSKTLGHVCLHVEAVTKIKDVRSDVLPQYSCLVLSPANFWHQDVQQFAQDSSILNTVFNHQNLQKGKTSVAEMLFGMHLSDTGIKRYPLRNRQRILQYAITLFLKEYDELFISGLRYKLRTLYPLYQNLTQPDSTSVIYNDTAYIYYPGEFNYNEFFPVATAFFLLFLYYYFSVRKIELINSKIAMAFTVLLTVLTSLGMTLGICFFFGLTFSLQGKEIFPYLVILVGLENVLVITKSVVSTPQHLDAKIRVAQGLCKEGWSITKNLLIEITILTIGLFTFVPAIQEFCIFAVVGLLTDFFLQMLFFYTVLGIDTRHVENLVDKHNPNYRNSLYQTHFYEKSTINSVPKTGMHRSKSHPRLSTDVVAGQIQGGQEKKIPKRLRLVNIWARTRFFQRAFMLLMVIWIARILYSSGIVEQYIMELTEKNNHKSDLNKDEAKRNMSDIALNLSSLNLHKSFETNDVYVNFVTQRSIDFTNKHNQTGEIIKLKHRDYPPWLRLSTQHWAAILKKYNVSLSGKSIVVLPNIKISHAISPQQAILLRNSDEKNGQKFHWQTLAAALDPIDFNDLDGSPESSMFFHSDRPLYPSSPMEILLTTILCFISVLVLAYAFVVLYRCICSRNYAEWRASWFSDKTEENEVQVLLEAVPVVLDGHPQEIECISTDGLSVASSCLGGQIKVWDTVTGELLKTIDRKSYFTVPTRTSESNVDFEDNNLSDYESGSPPSRDETLSSLPSFQHKINTNFTNLKLQPVSNLYNSRFDFGIEYRELYAEHKKEQKLKRRNNDTVKWVQMQRQNSDYEFNNKRNSQSEILNNFFFGEVPSPIKNDSESVFNKNIASIWCMDYLENLIVIGCADGSLEFWEGTTGKFRCSYDDGSGVGITSVKMIGSHVVAARLYGTLDFLQLQSYSQGRPIDWNFTCAYRRTHIRTSSAGSAADYRDIIRQHEDTEDIRCTKVLVTKAHQQPITCLDSEGGRVLTGSQDHSLKVFRLENGTPLYTLHGHCGPITCLFIDRVCPAMSGSGSQDGMLCVWDLLTGACMYSIQAHDGSIMSLTYSSSYVISLGSDEKLCVWERFQGHLLNTIQILHSFPSDVLMLTPHLIVTARSGGLVVWDVRNGECVKTIALGHSPFVFVKQMLLVRDVVLCDFGNQLRMVRFPLIKNKFD